MKTKKQDSTCISIRNLLSKNSPYSWRSFFAFISVMTVSTVLLCTDRLQAENWVNLVIWVGGVFISAETVRKFSSKKEEVETQASETTENDSDSPTSGQG